MSKFNVGDRVKIYVGEEFNANEAEWLNGRSGTVIDTYSRTFIDVRMDDRMPEDVSSCRGYDALFYEYELELL